jgi:hypothetical protein
MRIWFVLTALFSLQALAQDTNGPEATGPESSPPVPAPEYCQSPEHRQFDFWLGEWDVTANEAPAGSNRVESIMNGCAVQENWQGAGGISGTSFNIYDRDTGQWHQTWVDSSGTLLQLDGGLQGNDMVMQGQRPVPASGGTAIHRIRWTPNEDGTVRQLWEASQDSGASWSVMFDGLYAPREAAE